MEAASDRTAIERAERILSLVRQRVPYVLVNGEFRDVLIEEIVKALHEHA